MDESTQKTCSKCKVSKPRGDFHRDGRQGDGRVSRCKSCIAEYKRVNKVRFQEKDRARKQAWHQANREAVHEKHRVYRAENAARIAERTNAWYVANRDAKAAYDRAYREANREELAARFRTYYEANRERYRANDRAWRLANPGRSREADRTRQQVRRARKLGASIGEIDLPALWDAQEGLCGLCGEVIDDGLRWPHPMSPSVDHIVPLSRGGTHEQSNLQWTHLIGNTRKGAKLPDSP